MKKCKNDIRTFSNNDCFWNFFTTFPRGRGGILYFTFEYENTNVKFFTEFKNITELNSQTIPGICKIEGLFFNADLNLATGEIALQEFRDIYLPAMDYYHALYENQFKNAEELQKKKEEYEFEPDGEIYYLTLKEKLQELKLEKYYDEIKDIVRRWK